MGDPRSYPLGADNLHRRIFRDQGLLLAGVESNIIVYGHLHIPYIRSWGQKQLVNISSVSMPGDGDPRAKYGLFTWDGDSWSFERKYVSFDMAGEIAAYQTRMPTGWQNFVETIIVKGCVPQSV